MVLNLNDLFSLIASHKWVALAALIIGLFVRLLKGDSPLPFLPARYRVWVALGLGVASGALDSIANGTPWKDAILGGLLSAVVAIAGHEGLIESLRGGREIQIPGLTTPPAPPVPKASAVALLFFALAATGAEMNTACGASFGTVASYADFAVSDAQALLGFAQSMVDGYFASHPNADAQAKADKGISDATLALDAGIRALQGVTSATQGQVTEAFASFAKAWADLEKILADLGVLQAPAPNAVAAGRPALPTPILVRGARK